MPLTLSVVSAAGADIAVLTVVLTVEGTIAQNNNVISGAVTSAGSCSSAKLLSRC